MPRNYSRKTEVMSYTSEDLSNAMHAIRQGRKIREVGRAFNIPESTLRKYKNLQDDGHHQPRLGRQPVFTKEIEAQLKEYVLKLAKLFFGLTPTALRRIAFRYAEENKVSHNFNHEKGLAGKDWLYGFLKRAPEISLRQPEGTSLNRIYSFNKDAVDTFYSNLRMLMEKFKFEANRVFNMDETGITTVQKKCPKVYGPKGVKKVGAAISGERGRTITGVFCVNAAGHYLPPMLIYPRKRMPAIIGKNGPIGALYKCSKNGWITSELFVEWLHHFEKHVKPTETDPVLLVLDNHHSHISLEAYNFCKTKNIHMVSIPPHTSDHLQVLDITVFSPLKNALYRQYELYLSTTGHQKITEYDVAELLNNAFMQVATMEKAISGFKTSGIFPFNPDKFKEEDFAPTNQAKEFTVEGVNDIAPLTPRQNNESLLAENSTNYPVNYRDPQPSTSKGNSFFIMAPIAKQKENMQVKRKSREKQRSEILTSTPVKEKLEEAQKRKRVKEEETMKRKEKALKKGTVRKCFDDQSEKKLKGKQKIRSRAESESSDSSEGNLSNICDDDELDDLESSSEVPSPQAPTALNDFCCICGETGKDNELWYRCVLCGSWNHAQCAGVNTPKNYKCDFCMD